MRTLVGDGGILSYFARHKTAANLLLLVLLAAGIAAFPRMRTQFFPDVIIDTVTVSVNWDGAGAEDVDQAIMQVLEPALWRFRESSIHRAHQPKGAQAYASNSSRTGTWPVRPMMSKRPLMRPAICPKGRMIPQ